MVKIDFQASFKRHLLTGVALLGLMGSASGAFAADAAKADATINEVVITAQHRQENVQKVAIAITAMSADELSAQGVIGFRELGTRLPSLRFGAGVTGGENVITMRGLGSQNTTPGGDSPVAYNIDGVYVQRTTAIDPEFYDIARVEVLRGPQGTLYGRNSVGGSINIVTKKPTASFEGGADAMVGNYDARTVRGFVSGPLIDAGDFKVLGRLTAVSANHGSYSENLSTKPNASKKQDAQDYTMVRGQLDFELSAKTNLILSGSASKNEGIAATNVAWWQVPSRYTAQPLGIKAGSACDFSTKAKFNPRKFCHDAAEHATNDNQLFTATFETELPFARFTAVSGFGHSKVEQVADGDGSDLPMALSSQWSMNAAQYSQELRLSSINEASPAKWVVGAIYFASKNNQDYGYSDFGYNDIPALVGYDTFNFYSHGNSKTQAFAPFAQIDYDLAKTSMAIPLTITAGLRYTRDKKYGYNELDYQLPIFCGGSCAHPKGLFSKTWSRMTGKLGLSYQASETTMLYASVSKGYLAGGNIIGLASVYAPESLTSYDAGFKSRFFDNRLQLNVAAYHEQIQGLQVFIQSSTQSGINNVNGKTNVNGLEVEFTAIPAPNLKFNGSVTITNAEYGRYITTDTRFGGPGPGCSATTKLCNFEGHKLNQTPPYAVNLGAEYRFQTEMGSITPRIDTFFSGKVHFLPDNLSPQDAYRTTNIHVTWNSTNGRYLVDAFVNNVEDEDVISNDGLQSISLGQQGLEPDNFVYYPPRVYGVRVGVNF